MESETKAQPFTSPWYREKYCFVYCGKDKCDCQKIITREMFEEIYTMKWIEENKGV